MERVAVRRALGVAAALSAELADVVSPQPPSQPRPAIDDAINDAYDVLIDDPELQATSRGLFRNRHWAQAVEEAFKYINNLVKHRTGLSADGADLMNRTFSPKDPLLRLSALKTESQRDQQLGYMQIMSGVMTGIRNPRAHEHRYLDDPRVALELLCLANHLSRTIREATRVRRRRRP